MADRVSERVRKVNCLGCVCVLSHGLEEKRKSKMKIKIRKRIRSKSKK